MLLSLIEQNKTYEEIAKKLGRTIPSVKYQMSQKGLKITNVARQRIHKEKHKGEIAERVKVVQQLAAKDYYLTEIARQVGTSPNVIKKLCDEYGIEITERAKERMALAGEKTTQGKSESICWYCKNTNLNACSLFDPAKLKDNGKYVIPPYVKDYKTSSNGVSVKQCDKYQQER